MRKRYIKLTTGEEFPVEINLGAMLLFRAETGREATDADMSSLTDLALLLWAGMASASEVEGIKFGYTPQQMANRLATATLTQWAQSLAAEPKDEIPGEAGGAGEVKKKRNPRAVRPRAGGDGAEPA